MSGISGTSAIQKDISGAPDVVAGCARLSVAEKADGIAVTASRARQDRSVLTENMYPPFRAALGF
ncbi:MAG: hypothetical protein PsegKO_06320 [Pseudohongiellaceae bacterium]